MPNSTRRRTKIIATLGPATHSPEMIEQLIKAGMNVARLNMSHAKHTTVEENVRHIREISKRLDIPVAILMDTQGLSETEAFRKIQKMSMNNRKPMRAVAEAIILAHQVSEQ